MIPTEFKQRLPKHLSYPIGAEALSEALADTPNVEAITLFFGTSQWPVSGTKSLTSGLPTIGGATRIGFFTCTLFRAICGTW